MPGDNTTVHVWGPDNTAHTETVQQSVVKGFMLIWIATHLLVHNRGSFWKAECIRTIIYKHNTQSQSHLLAPLHPLSVSYLSQVSFITASVYTLHGNQHREPQSPNMNLKSAPWTHCHEIMCTSKSIPLFSNRGDLNLNPFWGWVSLIASSQNHKNTEKCGNWREQLTLNLLQLNSHIICILFTR